MIWPPSPPTHTHSEGDSGTIRFLGPTGDVEVVKFYWSSDRLQFGDQVRARGFKLIRYLEDCWFTRLLILVYVHVAVEVYVLERS